VFGRAQHGVSISQGRYVAFQDSDDEWVLDKLAKAVAALEGTEPETGVFYSDMLRVNTDGSCADFRSPNIELGVFVNESTLDYQVSRIGIQSAVIKRECFDEVGYFDEALPRFIDLELFIRLSDKYRFVHCGEMLVKYHDVAGISKNRQALVTARRHLLRKYHWRLKRQRHHLASQYLHLASSLWQNGEKSTSLWLILRALLTSPRNAGIWKKLFRVICRAGEEAVAHHAPGNLAQRSS
jgi:glycosyl transferase family 2